MIESSTAIALFASLATLAAQQPQHLLRLETPPGKQWFHVHQEMSYVHAAPRKDAIQRTRLEMFWEAEGFLDLNGARRMRDRIYRLRVADTGAGSGRSTASYTYDSATDEPPPGPLRSYTALLDGEATWRRSELGAVSDRELPDAWCRYDERIGSPDLHRSLLLRPMDLQLPDQPVAVGSRWPGSNLPAGFDETASRIESEFTLVSVLGDMATIRERFDMMPIAPEGAPQPSEDEGTRAMRTYTLDMRTGQVVATEARTTIQTTLRGRPIHLRICRWAKAVGEPTRGSLPPLAPPSLSDR